MAAHWCRRELRALVLVDSSTQARSKRLETGKNVRRKVMNKVILSGFAGKDAECRTTQSGQPVMNVSLATTEKWTTESGEKKEKTEWHTLVMFGKRASALAPHIKKGTRLGVLGSLQTRKWQDKQGNDRYTTEIKIDDLEFQGGGNRQEAGRGQQGADHGGFDANSTGDFAGGDSDDIPF